MAVHNSPCAYIDLGTIKDAGNLNITNTSYDSMLLMWAETASRFVNEYCHRYFYCKEGIKYFDGVGQTLNLTEDVLSITELALDPSGTKTYPTVMATTDYEMYPLNLFPTTYLKIATNAAYSNFATNIKAGVRITGVFGYGNGDSATPYYDSGITATSGATGTITLSASGIVFPGMTIRLGTEQAYILSLAGLVATAQRGVNGTTAASHVSTEAYIYQYHPSVVGATMIQLSIWWKRRESGFAARTGNSISGEYEIYKGLDEGVAAMLNAGGLVRRAF